MMQFDAELISMLTTLYFVARVLVWKLLIRSNSCSQEIIIYRLVLSMCLKNLIPDGTLCSLQYVVMTTVCVMFSSL